MRLTSDPRRYSSGIFGLRNYTVDGHNYDSYCNGYHNAVDLAHSHLFGIQACADGYVEYGTRKNGTFGGQVLIVHEQLGIQILYGHVDRNLLVKVGQKVKKGQVIARQSNTHNQGANVSMASHLHMQVYPIQAYDEYNFTCFGIDPFKIDITKGADKTESVKSSEYIVKKGDTLWSIGQKFNISVDKIKKDNNLKNDTINPEQKLKIGKSESKAPQKPSVPAVTDKFKIGKFKINKYGTQFASASGTFINGNEEIERRHGSPFTSEKSAGHLKAGARFEIDEVCRQDSHIWLKEKGKNIYTPVKTWNKDGSVGQSWGNF